MTVGKISGLCWAVFGVMCVGFLPLAFGIMQIGLGRRRRRRPA
jgi:hypothetical protein